MNEQNIKDSISELKRRLQKRFGSELELYLFGSVARNNYEPDSDIDILVLVPVKVDTNLKEDIIDLAYDIELGYDVVFGIIVRSKEFWTSEKAAAMPFHQHVQREALRI
ncbi:MAG: nucleotidyltransferase domain-containing protein [Candidatus Aminicenantes bacterium]|nr:nucleotidyltransferase domain-containing protein [Candidatus Aminicenantes bacterium]